MLHDQTIVCFSSLSWDFLWLRHQELMVRFARAGNRVLFVEPIGIRMPKWEDWRRIVARVQHRREAGRRGIREVMPNVWVLDPLVNPFQQIGFVHEHNVKGLTAQLQNALAQLDGDKPIIWTFVPTPLARAVIGRISHKLVVYDCMDALTENPKGVFSSFAESEKMLSREADLVFVTSHALLERQLPLNPRTYYVPHGVEYEKFADESQTEPAALQAIPHPRLTFFGGIDERVDLELLAQLARKYPAWQIVLLGVIRTDTAALQKFPNVHFLGHIPHDALPAYLHCMDVFLLPYRHSSFSHYINPAKLHECLAVGKPTVATALPVFEEYRDVLRVADSADRFEPLVIDALAEGRDEMCIERRRARARENTWEARFGEINARVEERLG